MKQVQRQQLQQKLSPQQIQLMRLLQLPVTELEQAIKEEIEKNPMLEADMPVNEEAFDSLGADNDASDWDTDEEEYEYDYREHLESDPNEVRREYVLTDTPSSAERLMQQLNLRPLTERQHIIATELIGSLDDAGYLNRDLALIANDMAFQQGIEADLSEMNEALAIVQSLDPAGIGARNLQECLLLQLERNRESSANADIATAIVRDHFDDFANHRYDRICEALGIDNGQLEEASDIIRRLNPKPGDSEAESDSAANHITPDIILQQHDGELHFYLNDGNLPQLSLNSYYVDMLNEMEKSKGDRATIQFLRSKQTDAQGFIDMLQQRHDTIVRVMRYLVKHQRQFLLTGDTNLLLPLRQREVAEATGLDISTISRMANSKYLQTDFGTIPLKECFSKGMAIGDGEEVSVETVKQRLADAINAEDKRAPLSDEALTQLLNGQGLPLARRTVAKYREQLGFPVARLRRLIIVLLLLTGLQANAQMSYYDSIINAKIEAGKKVELKVKSEEQRMENKGRKVKSEVKKEDREAAASANSDPRTLKSELAPYMVPMWYDAFPQNRVNPMGRTRVDIMPDEININLIHDTSEFCFPVKKVKTSNYGWRWQRGHHGVDIGLKTGEPIHCAFGGVVRVAARMGGYGNCIVVRHPNGLETLYGHLSRIDVKPHQEVRAGQIIGLGGSTGNSTGPHLHFEVRFLYQPFDPEWILDFDTYRLRTRRLHLDKSYFGIRKPQKGQSLEYKADESIIKESKKNRKSSANPLNPKDF